MLSTYFTSKCRCLREGTAPNYTYRPNPNWPLPAATPPLPPQQLVPVPVSGRDSDAEDAADDTEDAGLTSTPFFDPALDPYLGFWLSDAILDLRVDQSLQMTTLLTAAIHSPASMTSNNWEALGKLLLACIETANAE